MFEIENNFKYKIYQTSIYLYRLIGRLFTHIFLIKSSRVASYINYERNPNISEFTGYHLCGVPSTRQSHRSLRLVLQLLDRWQTNPHIVQDRCVGMICGCE
jgi:hypothetical protein